MVGIDPIAGAITGSTAVLSGRARCVTQALRRWRLPGLFSRWCTDQRTG